MDFKNIIYEKEDRIAIIRLNRPEKRNAFNVEMGQEFGHCLNEANEDDNIRVIIITGEGEAFSSGGDLANISKSYTGEKPFELPKIPSRIPRMLRGFDKPIIAAINGAAAGAGYDLALICDLRIASERAKFSETYVKLGMVPAGGSYLLPRLVGLQKACELIFTGEWIDGKEAERIGLVLKMVPHGELLKEAKDLASKIANNAKMAVRLSKHVIYKGLDTDYNSHLEFVAYTRAVLKGSKGSGEGKEGTKAFLEKRAIKF